MYKRIITPRLVLFSGEPELLNAAIEGNEALKRLLKVTIPDQYSEFGSGVMHYSRSMLVADSNSLHWWTYFPVHAEDQILVGTCGYKGPPNNGCVEIGYEIIPQYRGRGLATEMAKALIENAFQFPEVKVVLAHTLAVKNASGSILGKCGFQQTETLEDEEDGTLWRWELKIK